MDTTLILTQSFKDNTDIVGVADDVYACLDNVDISDEQARKQVRSFLRVLDCAEENEIELRVAFENCVKTLNYGVLHPEAQEAISAALFYFDIAE